MRQKIGKREGRAFVWLLFAQVNMLGKSKEREYRGLEEGFRNRMVFIRSDERIHGVAVVILTHHREIPGSTPGRYNLQIEITSTS